jgi:hypothetical protein
MCRKKTVATRTKLVSLDKRSREGTWACITSCSNLKNKCTKTLCISVSWNFCYSVSGTTTCSGTRPRTHPVWWFLQPDYAPWRPWLHQITVFRTRSVAWRSQCLDGSKVALTSDERKLFSEASFRVLWGTRGTGRQTDSHQQHSAPASCPLHIEPAGQTTIYQLLSRVNLPHFCDVSVWIT